MTPKLPTLRSGSDNGELTPNCNAWDADWTYEESNLRLETSGEGDLDVSRTWSRFTGDRARPSGNHRSEPSSQPRAIPRRVGYRSGAW
jgi:hypothetical protein